MSDPTKSAELRHLLVHVLRGVADVLDSPGPVSWQALDYLSVVCLGAFDGLEQLRDAAPRGADDRLPDHLGALGDAFGIPKDGGLKQ